MYDLEQDSSLVVGTYEAISATGLTLSKSGTIGGKLWVWGEESTITNTNLKDSKRTTPARVCADANGILIICPN